MPASSLRRDVISAYAASLSRIASWAIISALVFRRSREAFAILALVRGTIGILNYVSLGLLPALVRTFAEIATPSRAVADVTPEPVGAAVDYATPETTRSDRGRRAAEATTQGAFATGMLVAVASFIVGVIASFGLLFHADRVFQLPPPSTGILAVPDWPAFLILAFGVGIAMRWLADPASALLQAHGHLFLDNVVQAFSEILWVALVAVWLGAGRDAPPLITVGTAYLIASGLLVTGRLIAARATGEANGRSGIDVALLRPLLVTGSLITLAQLADYLYSPTDYLLINHLLTPADLANYAPAVQVDGGLMVLVSGLAAVLLPRAAVAHVAGDRVLVRRYYVRGTLATGAMLVVAAGAVWLASPWIFRLWLHDSMPGTRAILPLVLVHTVLGGSSAVGRSILLGMGKAKPLTVAVLIAGGVNVACSYAFVQYLHWGLAGIVLGTIVAVVGRCAIWMPWYVLRELKRGHVREDVLDRNRDAMVVDPGT